MINEEFRNKLDNYCDEVEISPLLFDNPAFDNSIIGVSDDNRIVYDYDKMVEELAEDDNISYEESMEFIDYNTMRAIPYGGQGAPIILGISREKIEELY